MKKILLIFSIILTFTTYSLAAGSGGGSTANTVVIDSGNQAPAGAISIGGTGGNGKSKLIDLGLTEDEVNIIYGDN